MFLFGLQLQLVSQTNLNNILRIADSIYYSNPDSSYKLSQIAEELAAKQNDELNIANAKTYIARYLLLKSSLQESQLKLNEAIDIYIKTNSLNELAFAYKLKAILLKRIGRLEESINLEEQAVTIYTKTNNTEGLIGALLNISVDYIETHKFNKAQATFNQIENLIPHLSKINKYFLHQNKGKLNAELKRYDVAITEYISALLIANENKMIDSQATILMELGKVYRLVSNFQKAKEYLSQSELICVNNNLKHEQIETYEEIIQLYQATANYSLAFNFLKLQNELKNEIINIEKINKINDLEKKLALNKKEKEIDEAKQKNTTMVYIVCTITCIALMLIILIIRSIKLKNKIQIKNQIIQQKQEEILDSIKYARRIQQSLLPTEKYIERNLKKK